MPGTAVALFTYNRPDKTAAVLSALARQDMGKLYVFCDGPKNDRDKEAVRQNIEIIKSFSNCDKHVQLSKENQGLARSLISGISTAFESAESLVILEDDCLPLPNMMSFIEQNLSHWREFPDVFSISAHHFIRGVALKRLPYDIFFSKRFLCWGWATWRNRWLDIEHELEKMINPFGSFEKVPQEAGKDLPFHAYTFEKNQVDSWAIPLALITLERNYRHVMPRLPLVSNMGMDGSGTHCGSASTYIRPEGDVRYGLSVKMCPPDYEDMKINRAFSESMMVPPKWFESKLAEKSRKSETEDSAHSEASV